MGPIAQKTERTAVTTRCVSLLLAAALILLPILAMATSAAALERPDGGSGPAVQTSLQQFDDDHCPPAPGPADGGCQVHCLDWNSQTLGAMTRAGVRDSDALSPSFEQVLHFARGEHGRTDPWGAAPPREPVELAVAAIRPAIYATTSRYRI